MAALEVVLVTTDRTVWSGQAVSVSAPAHDGQLGILRGHSPVLAALGSGVVEIGLENAPTVRVEVAGGFFSVDDNKVMIIADHAQVQAEAKSSH